MIVPILRAGLGFVHAAQELMPAADVGFIGISRDEETFAAQAVRQQAPRVARRPAGDRDRPDAGDRRLARAHRGAAHRTRRARRRSSSCARSPRPRASSACATSGLDLHVITARDRRAPQRPRLHRPRPRRRRRPPVRQRRLTALDETGASTPVEADSVPAHRSCSASTAGGAAGAGASVRSACVDVRHPPLGPLVGRRLGAVPAPGQGLLDGHPNRVLTENEFTVL